MIDLVFNGGGKQDDFTQLVPGQKTIGVTLLLLGIALIPVMLLVKPLCCRSGHKEDEDNEIEFTNIRQDDMQQNLLQPGIQRESADNSLSQRNATEEMMAKRQDQMKSLDA